MEDRQSGRGSEFGVERRHVRPAAARTVITTSRTDLPQRISPRSWSGTSDGWFRKTGWSSLTPSSAITKPTALPSVRRSSAVVLSANRLQNPLQLPFERLARIKDLLR